MNQHGWHLYAPLTAALIETALGLPTAPYEPGTNSTMRKIVDDHGQNAGYATFVERMANESRAMGVEFFFGTQAIKLGVIKIP